MTVMSSLLPADARTTSLVAGITQLGPLTLPEIQRLWWPCHAERTVQRALRRLCQAGRLQALVPYATTDGHAHRTTGTRYAIPGRAREPPVGSVATTRRTLLDALHAVCAVPGLLGVQTPSLLPDGRGQLLVLRRCRRDPPTTAALFTWLTDACPADAAERAFLLVVDDGQLALERHTQAAAGYARICAPVTWRQPFPPPVPLLVTTTPARERDLALAWRRGWAGCRILTTHQARLADGWLVPVWTAWDGPIPRLRLWLEGWLPDRLTPANDTRWDVADYWRRPDTPA